MAAAPEVIAAARHLSGLGYNLVAVRADKRPWGRDWRRVHTLGEVEKLLAGPDCPAIGFLGGELNGHIVALDFDNFKGETWFRHNCGLFGLDPYGWPTVVTPGKVRPDGMRFKGRHRYMLDDRGLLGNSAGSLAQIGIDVRGKGHTMLPPSPHPDGGVYEWMEGHSFDDFPRGIPPVPDWVYDAIAEPAPRAENTAADNEAGISAASQNPDIPGYRAGGFEPGAKANGPDPASGWAPSDVIGAERRRVEAYARQALMNARARLAGATEGQRNVALNNEALGLGHLAHLGVFGEGEALSTLMAACEANGLIGSSGIKAVHATFYSGWKKGLSEPRELQDRPQGPPRPDPRDYKPDWTSPGFDGSEPPPPPPGSNYDPETGEVPPGEGIGEWDAGDLEGSLPPPRGWLLGNVFCRTVISSLLAAGGTGKTAVRIAQALALATGQPITGEHIFLRCRVLYICLEDDRDELWRRLLAAMKHHDIAFADIRGWLYLATPASLGLRLAQIKDRELVEGELGRHLEATIRRRNIDLVILDPFIKSHAVDENSNPQIDFVANLLAQIATRHKIAIDVPHHIAKGLADPGNSDKGRGASSFRDAFRLGYTLAPMTSDEAETYGIPEGERRLLIRMDSAKVNITPPADDAKWFKLIGVDLGNTTDLYPHGDNVQTIELWRPPGVWADVSPLKAREILLAIDKGLADGRRYSDSPTAGDAIAAWCVVQQRFPDKNKKQCRAMVAAWLKSGVLVKEEYTNPLSRETAKGLRAIHAKLPSTDMPD